MVGATPAARIPSPPLVWGALALGAGVGAAALPVEVSLGLLALAGLAVAIVIEPALGMVVMLCVAPLKVLVTTEVPLALPGDIGQWSLALALGAWALWRASRAASRPLPRTRVAAALLLILGGFVPSLFAAQSALIWLSEAAKWIAMLALVLVVLDLGERGRWTWLASGVVLAAALQAIIGLYEYQGGSGAPHLWIAGYTRFRAFGTFGQPNPFSAFMGLTLPLALGLGWGFARCAWGRWRAGDCREALPAAAAAAAYAGGALLIAGGLLTSWGRGAWLGAAAALGAMVVFAPRQRWHGAALLAAALTLAAGLWLSGLVPPGIAARASSVVADFTGFGDMRGVFITNENFSMVERLAHWQAALNMASAHPWVGVGLGHYEAAYPAFALARWPHALGHAHNDYLNLLAETGIIGLVTALTGWTLIVTWTVQALRVRAPVMNGLVLGLLGSWIHFAVHSAVDKLTVNNLFLHIGVMLGLLAIVDRARRRAAEDAADVIS